MKLKFSDILFNVALSDLQSESINIQLVNSGLQIPNSSCHAELVSASVNRINKGIPKQVWNDE